MRYALALCCLFGFSTSAFAECAWVLYAKQAVYVDQKKDKTEWEWRVVSAYPSYAACMQNNIGKVVQHGPDGLGFGQECLPDSVDPRGLKGK